MAEEFQPIRIADVMARIEEKCFAPTVVIVPSERVISRLDDNGKLAAARMIVKGFSYSK